MYKRFSQWWELFSIGETCAARCAWSALVSRLQLACFALCCTPHLLVLCRALQSASQDIAARQDIVCLEHVKHLVGRLQAPSLLAH